MSAADVQSKGLLGAWSPSALSLDSTHVPFSPQPQDQDGVEEKTQEELQQMESLSTISAPTLLESPCKRGTSALKRQNSPRKVSMAAQSVFGTDSLEACTLEDELGGSSKPKRRRCTHNFKLWRILVFVFVSINVGLSAVVSMTWYVSNSREVKELLEIQADLTDAHAGTCESAMAAMAEELVHGAAQLALTLVENYFVWPEHVVNTNVDLSLPEVGLLQEDEVSRATALLWQQLRYRFPKASQIYIAFASGLYVNFMKFPLLGEERLDYGLELRAPAGGLEESRCSGRCPAASTRRPGHTSHYSLNPDTGHVDALLSSWPSDPRREDWYQLAVAGGGRVVWTECYKFVTGRAVGLRALRATFINGEPAMVAGSDLGLSVLTDFLMEVQSAAGYKRAFILCRRGYLFASSQGMSSFMKFNPDGTIQRQLMWHESEDPMVNLTVSALIKQYGDLKSVPDSGSSMDKTQEYAFGFQTFVPQGGFTRLASISEHAPDWLVVTVGLFSEKMDPIREQSQKLRDLEKEEELKVQAEIHGRTSETLAFCITFTILGAALMTVISRLITSSLKTFALDMLSVARLDFLQTREASFSSPPVKAACHTKHVIREVAQMREAFVSMSNGLQSFARYMDPNVVHLILESRREAKLGVAPAELTIFFSDIAGFTTIAECLPPVVFMDILGEYLDEMSRIIMESRGIVGEFIGDAIMAWWNDPIVLGPEHTAIGIRAALAQQEKLAELRQQWLKKGLPEVKARMGLVRGSVFAGNIGSTQRMKYGLVGDSVNLASRLEGLCKTYGVDLMIEAAARAAPDVDDQFWCRPLDLVQVKGRSGCTELFQVVCEKQTAAVGKEDENLRAFVEDFKDIQELYRGHRFAEALAAVEVYLARWPHDVPAQLTESRCKEFLANAPGEEWSPVNKLDHK